MPYQARMAGVRAAIPRLCQSSKDIEVYCPSQVALGHSLTWAWLEALDHGIVRPKSHCPRQPTGVVAGKTSIDHHPARHLCTQCCKEEYDILCYLLLLWKTSLYLMYFELFGFVIGCGVGGPRIWIHDTSTAVALLSLRFLTHPHPIFGEGP